MSGKAESFRFTEEAIKCRLSEKVEQILLESGELLRKKPLWGFNRTDTEKLLFVEPIHPSHVSTASPLLLTPLH